MQVTCVEVSLITVLRYGIPTGSKCQYVQRCVNKLNVASVWETTIMQNTLLFKAIKGLDLRFAESKEDSHLLKQTVYQAIDFSVVFFILTRPTTRSDRRKSKKESIRTEGNEMQLKKIDFVSSNTFWSYEVAVFILEILIFCMDFRAKKIYILLCQHFFLKGLSLDNWTCTNPFLFYKRKNEKRRKQNYLSPYELKQFV